jgi:hypothetical protein
MSASFALGAANFANRAERRRQKAQWRRDTRKMVAQANGLFGITICRPGFHEPTAASVKLIGQWLGRVLGADAPEQLCLLCDHVFGSDALPAAFLFFGPRDIDGFAHGTVSVAGLCEQHARLCDMDLAAAAVAKLRASFLPDARMLSPINMMSAVGRA